jgi:hypothetical protein
MGGYEDRFIAFIRNDNLYLASMEGRERQLTIEGALKDVTCGESDYLLQVALLGHNETAVLKNCIRKSFLYTLVTFGRYQDPTIPWKG